jgi:hypothetical protein
MFMTNYLTAPKSTGSGWLSDAFSWGKKNLSISNVNKLGSSISNLGQQITGAINSGKTALSDAASGIGRAAGRGFFEENKWWIIGGAGLVALLVVFSMRRK